MATVPAPASSPAACGFPARRLPARVAPRVMRPRRLGARSAVAAGLGRRCTARVPHRALADATSSSRTPGVAGHASAAAAPAFPPTLSSRRRRDAPRHRRRREPSPARSGCSRRSPAPVAGTGRLGNWLAAPAAARSASAAVAGHTPARCRCDGARAGPQRPGSRSTGRRSGSRTRWATVATRR
jgi:hypothetical protein